MTMAILYFLLQGHTILHNVIKNEGVMAIFVIVHFSNFLYWLLFCNLLGAKGPQKGPQGPAGPSAGLWPPVDYKIETSI